MTSFQISLRALKHPAVLVCIIILILNDHLLKITFPSFWTGKISDITGLFFFPFVMIALIGLFIKPLNIRPRVAAKISYGFIFLIFICAKTIPSINNNLEEILRYFYLRPVEIALDPTDLFACLSLYPSWLLWCFIENTNVRSANYKYGLLILAIASIGSIASIDCAAEPYMDRVVVHGGLYYTALTEKYGMSSGELIYASSDDGKIWDKIETVPDNVKEEIIHEVSVPRVVCTQDLPGICFRITGQPLVEISRDGGSTWQTDWEYPQGREYYVQRLERGICTHPLTESPVDIALLQNGPNFDVAVAYGNQGALVRNQADGWEQKWVFNLSPKPMHAKDLSEAIFSVNRESLIIYSIAFGLWSISSILIIRKYLHQNSTIIRKNRILSLLYIGVSIGIFSILFLGLDTYLFNIIIGIIFFLAYAIAVRVGFLSFPEFTTSQLIYPQIIIIILPILIISMAWIRLYLISDKSKIINHSAIAVLGLLFGSFVLGILPLLLWAFGIIPYYGSSIVLTIGIEVAMLIGTIFWLRNTLRKIEIPSET